MGWGAGPMKTEGVDGRKPSLIQKNSQCVPCERVVYHANLRYFSPVLGRRLLLTFFNFLRTNFPITALPFGTEI